MYAIWREVTPQFLDGYTNTFDKHLCKCTLAQIFLKWAFFSSKQKKKSHSKWLYLWMSPENRGKNSFLERMVLICNRLAWFVLIYLFWDAGVFLKFFFLQFLFQINMQLICLKIQAGFILLGKEKLHWRWTTFLGIWSQDYGN